MRAGRYVRLIVALGVVTAFAAGSPARTEESTLPEEYTALAVNLNAGPGPSSGRFNIRVKRWSTDEQRGSLLKVLAEKGSDALVDALQDQEPAGTINFTGQIGYDLRYARQIQDGDTRRLVLATDRPVTFGELIRMSRSLDKGVTIVILTLDAEGKGSGDLLVGAELSLDPAKGELTVEHLGTNPVKLNQVKKQ